MQSRSAKDWALPQQENEATKVCCVELERECVATSRILSRVIHELNCSASDAYLTHRVKLVELNHKCRQFQWMPGSIIGTWLKLANMTTSLRLLAICMRIDVEAATHFGKSGNIVALSWSRRRSSSVQRVDTIPRLELYGPQDCLWSVTK